MSFSELLDTVKALPRAEKIQMMQALAKDITPEEALIAKPFPPGALFEVFTPFDCHEAAAALQALLEEDRRQ